ncbi:MAG: hypothetical protein GY856_36855 [bacterium]|nr:hypothetical protein [bacterium]
MSLTNLPPLTGSEKQIAWAEEIRHGVLENLDREIETQIANAERNLAAERQGVAEGDPESAEEVARLERVLPALRTLGSHARAATDSAWWIETASTARNLINHTVRNPEETA